jgi:LemA protein
MWELIIIAIVAVVAVGGYNSLVKLRETSDAAWTDIDVQLKRRHDVIPNLVETVKGYAAHESQTLEAVIQARNSAMTAQGPAQQAAAETQLSGALKSIFALSEAYPQLQTAGGFRDLQGTLAQLEETISQARRYYNAVVRDYNTKTQSFPSVFIAKVFNFSEKEFFEVAEAEKAVPKVSFGDKDD